MEMLRKGTVEITLSNVRRLWGIIAWLPKPLILASTVWPLGWM
ncbi:MAG: hypothetical protein ABIT61_04940 [Steroidobacteraceae bacterium]